jgi:hypothetical protein
MTITVHGTDLELTAETITATRAWYADNAFAMIAEAAEYVATNGQSGQRVNDIDSHKAWCEGMAAASLRGDSDHTFAFVQRALYIQTGESVALLPSA